VIVFASRSGQLKTYSSFFAGWSDVHCLPHANERMKVVAAGSVGVVKSSSINEPVSSCAYYYCINHDQVQFSNDINLQR
jgi:hypothetical protein